MAIEYQNIASTVVGRRCDCQCAPTVSFEYQSREITTYFDHDLGRYITLGEARSMLNEMDYAFSGETEAICTATGQTTTAPVSGSETDYDAVTTVNPADGQPATLRDVRYRPNVDPGNGSPWREDEKAPTYWRERTIAHTGVLTQHFRRVKDDAGEETAVLLGAEANEPASETYDDFGEQTPVIEDDDGNLICQGDWHEMLSGTSPGTYKSVVGPSATALAARLVRQGLLAEFQVDAIFAREAKAGAPVYDLSGGLPYAVYRTESAGGADAAGVAFGGAHRITPDDEGNLTETNTFTPNVSGSNFYPPAGSTSDDDDGYAASLQLAAPAARRSIAFLSPTQVRFTNGLILNLSEPDLTERIVDAVQNVIDAGNPAAGAAGYDADELPIYGAALVGGNQVIAIRHAPAHEQTYEEGKGRFRVAVHPTLLDSQYFDPGIPSFFDGQPPPLKNTVQFAVKWLQITRDLNTGIDAASWQSRTFVGAPSDGLVFDPADFRTDWDERPVPGANESFRIALLRVDADATPSLSCLSIGAQVRFEDADDADGLATSDTDADMTTSDGASPLSASS